jgi:hypothetical protein
MPTQLNISGQVLLSHSNLPIEGIRIEAWDSGNNYGLIASTYSNIEGNFQIIIDNPIATLVTNNTVVLSYRTLRGIVQLNNTASTVQGVLKLAISENTFDSNIPDSDDNASPTFVMVEGKVIDKHGVPASNVSVQVFENGFRNETLLSETTTNLYGSYTVKISRKTVANSKVLTARSIFVKAVSGEDIIASSGNVLLGENPNIEVDLIAIGSYQPPSYHENLLTKIGIVLGSVAFADFAAAVGFDRYQENNPSTINTVQEGDILAVAQDGNDNGELGYIAGAIGHTLSELQIIVRSYQFATESNTGHDFLHALTKSRGFNRNPILLMSEDMMRDVIAQSVSDNLIPTHTTEEIETFIAAAKVFQNTTTKNIGIKGEDFTLGHILNNIFAGTNAQSDTDEFLGYYNNTYGDINDFWSAYSAASATNAEKAKRGLRLASVTGFQPEMINDLMTQTTGGIHSLAEKSESDWRTYIDTICTQANKLCVPHSIIGDSTDEDAIKTLYAKKLKSIVQDMYPLTAMKVKLLDNQTGPTIISDSNIRDQATTFIANNPDFDLRMSNIFDINADNQDINFSGITDTVEVQQALGPIQRILRIVRGNPDAIATMIVNGHDSASAIADMSPETFSAAYASVLGGASVAAMAYSSAMFVSTTARMTGAHAYMMASTVPGGGAGSTLPAPPSSGGIPMPSGGGSSPSYADPTLTTLFGNLSYCACEQCLSMYSPAAYFTDIMNFIRQGAPTNPVYAELIRRRPDLEYIDMTCKNTNTVMPYIDLVIELLELLVIDTFNAAPPLSFQTTGTEKELAGHPEHKYKQVLSSGPYSSEYRDYPEYHWVYDPFGAGGIGSYNLTTEVYPYNLPFSLPAEETRTYLKHLGATRYELMKLFQPYTPPTVNPITDFDIYSELLGLTESQSTIVATPSLVDTWKFYGLKGASVSNFMDPTDTSLYVLPNPRAWDDLLIHRLDVLVQQLRISYKEFLQFLTTDFLNKRVLSGSAIVHPITVAANNLLSPAPPQDTCDLSKLRLVFPDSGYGYFFDKLHRFVRLWRTDRLSIVDWDRLFTALDITQSVTSTTTSLDAAQFELVGKVLELMDRTGLSVTEITGWWAYIDTHQYVDFESDPENPQPSVYDLAYRNKSAINPALIYFADLGNWDPATAFPAGSLPPIYEGMYTPLGGSVGFYSYIAQIASANQIKATELTAILDFMGVPLTAAVDFSVLSSVYAFSHLSKKLGYSIADLIEIHYTANVHLLTSPVTTTSAIAARLDELTDILNIVDGTKKSHFSLVEIDYLVRNVGDHGPIAPAPLNIEIFYEKLRNELQKFPIYSGAIPPSTPDETEALNKLTNVVYQHISKEFNISSEWASLIFANVPLFGSGTVSLPVTMSFIEVLVGASFVTSTVDITEQAVINYDIPYGSTIFHLNCVPYIYQAYRWIQKIIFIAKRLKINSDEFPYLFPVSAVGFNFTSMFFPIPTVLPGSSMTGALLRSLLQLTYWTDIRDKFSLIEDQLVILIKAADNSYASSLGDNLSAWQGIINRDIWGTMLVDLVGDPTTLGSTPAPTGLLNATFPSDYSPSNYKSITCFWGIIQIISICSRTGLKPKMVQKALYQDLVLEDAHKILLAAKGRHTEDEWAAIAKPLRDPLRIKQRDALVGFVLAYPDPVPTPFYTHYPVPGSKMKWRNENDLYAFLLIDTQMDPCMQTSRIKQAISSVQLYVDRVLMGLECQNTDTTLRVTLTPGLTFQWRQWREWYRIWEANRKVFLYPENWIEPELRDDKTVFFKELEAVLEQGDITTDHAEDAILAYLRKLESVARIEPIGACDTIDPASTPGHERTITYVFGRTYTDPHKYYFRQLKDFQWGGWEPIDIDIKSNHVAPVVHHGRLYLFWLTFREKNIVGRNTIVSGLQAGTTHFDCPWFYNDTSRPNNESSVNDPMPTGATPPTLYVKELEIALNWSEFKDGAWQDQKIGKEKIQLDLNPYLKQAFPKLFDTSAGFIGYPDIQKYTFLTKDRTMGLTDLVISRIHLFVESWMDGELYLWINHPHDYGFEDARTMQTITFNNGSPIVWTNSYNSGNIVAPFGTLLRDNKFVLYPTSYSGGGDKLYIDNIGVATPRIYKYSFETTSGGYSVRSRGTSGMILQKSPHGVYKLTPQTNTYLNALEKGFLYEDDTCTFFARLVNPASFPSSSSPVSISTAGQDADYLYQITPAGLPPGTMYSSSTISAGGRSLKFYFQTFYHGNIHGFLNALNQGGLDQLLQIQTQTSPDTILFNSNYGPQPIVYSGASGSAYPTNKVDFDFTGAYSVYNWELFFHIPLTIAKRLSANQQYEDARKWFHYIFDPTSTVDDTGGITGSKQRFWRFRPFYDLAGMTLDSLDDLLRHIHAGIADAVQQVTLWSSNPFKPHLIARMRILAYMKNVVMCYLDNLIAWGDKLFRRDTLESINEATNLYILAANILGQKPEEVPTRVEAYPRNFSELAAFGLDAFGNALVGLEHYIDPNSGITSSPSGSTMGTPTVPTMFYYCLPNNPKWLEYYDIVANRLFNIRHCRNIEGQERQLPLFEPPIDPALLVRAAAAGLDASSVLDDLNTPPMPYKFTVMLQKANELCNDVKALGSGLLAALEKKDAEALAVLRSGQEIAVFESMKQMKQAQIDEAAASIQATAHLKDTVQVRYDYYSSRDFMSGKETQHISLMDHAQAHQNTASTLSATASALSIIPEVNIQVPMAIGPSFGGRELSAVFTALSTIQAQKAAQKSAEATKTQTLAGYDRRMDDWKMQGNAAAEELAQIDRQVIAAQIRKAVAEKDLANLEVQLANAKETDDFMRSKYTNGELYNWMITQITTTYFQAYQLAYDVAKRAEKCLTFELPLINVPGTGFIKFGYWDSLKKGLLSAEKLQYDLRKMELAYLESNRREMELTKHISLAMHDPAMLLHLKEAGTCSFICDADLFNLDYPGHYLRRVKSVSVSIPCVAGPYTTIAATLTQSSSQIEDHAGTLSSALTSIFPIATSSGQNDSGMFELNFRDDRYLPFEGTGAICTWTLSLMDDKNLRQFDYNTISDVILHVKYTAQFDSSKQSTDIATLNDEINSLTSGHAPVNINSYFSLKHQFANAWFAYANDAVITGHLPTAQMSIVLDSKMFPYLCQGKKIDLNTLVLQLRFKAPLSSTASYSVEIESPTSTLPPTSVGTLSVTDPYSGTVTISLDTTAIQTVSENITPGAPVTYKLRLIDNTILAPVDMNTLLDDIYLVTTYKLELI